MVSAVLMNDGTVVWIEEAPDLLASAVADASRGELIAVRVVSTHDDGEDPSYEARTGYIRAGAIEAILPPGPKTRAHYAEARGER